MALKAGAQGVSAAAETTSTADDGVFEAVSSFEDLMKAVGIEGKWTTVLYIMCASCAFVSALQTLPYQFLGATPDYWCHVDSLVSANWTAEDIISIAVPLKDDADKRDFCKVYDYNFTKIADLSFKEALLFENEIKQSNIVSCSVRDFNSSQYKSTVTTEWDLVCEKRVLYSTTQAAAQAGKFVGYFFTGYLLDKFGRRPIVLICSTLTIISGFLSAASPNAEFYILVKIVITTMTSGVYLGCFVMSMETCSLEKRSMVGALFTLPWALGYMAVPGIAYLIRTWQWMQVAYTVPALSLIAYFWILPESPRWLILKGRYEEALSVLKWAASMNRKKLPTDEVILRAMETIGIGEAKKSSITGENDGLLTRMKKVVLEYLALLMAREFRVRTLVVYFCWFTASMVYYGVALNATNLSADPYLYVFLGGLLEVPAYLLLWPAVVYVGRTKSLVILYGVCGITILAITAVFLLAPGTPVGVTMFLSLTGKMAITAAFHLIWMFTAELFPTKYRSLAVSQSSVNARIGSLCSPYVNDILGEVVVWAPSLLFGSVSIVAAGLSLILPDTKGKNLPETIALEIKKGRNGEINESYIPEEEQQKGPSSS
ncbi:organic cation transporter protein-like [Palaemon carinicauda]|uniref:organic cation transporter protein-like n=1 Tax=Palaemon carinicauda TaxID=392227 RepID=UPI0035B619A0